jgi:histidinol-phosphatase
MPLDRRLALDTARRAVQAAGRAALAHFRRGVGVEWKADGSPVTAADRDAEAAILGAIRAAFPTHSILAEESGVIAGDPESRWFVDPLDGTRGFARGGTCWGPLVALEHAGDLLAAAMALPAQGITYWALRGEGAFRDGERVRVSAVARLDQATVCVGEMRVLLAPDRRDGVVDLVRAAASARCPGDLAGCATLLEGRADVWIEAGVKIWDLAAPRLLVEEAGGSVSDLGGAASIAAGEALATNGLLHAEALRRLRPGQT